MLKGSLLVAAAMSMTMAELFPEQRRGTCATPLHDMPTNEEMQALNRKRGDDAAAIAAAQAKRDRKNAKRAEASKRPNAALTGAEGVRVEGAVRGSE